LRVRILLLEDEVDHLNSQLATEEEQSDGLRRDLDAKFDQLDDLENKLQDCQNELRAKTRELEILKVRCGADLKHGVC
jgi:chromosome segregation ATPase